MTKSSSWKIKNIFFRKIKKLDTMYNIYQISQKVKSTAQSNE